MGKDSVVRTIGILAVLVSIILYIFMDTDKLGAGVLGVITGLGIGLMSNGEETKLFGKYIFKKKAI